MRRHTLLIILAATVLAVLPSTAQTLTLDSCRRLALANNKAMAISQAKQEKADYEHRVARTNYLPKVSLLGGYTYTTEEISLLSKDQKNALSNLGTNASTQMQQAAAQIVQQYPDFAALVQQFGQTLPTVTTGLNNVGQGIVDALRTDTRNMAVGAVLLTQPLYMGGKIRAYDRITDYARQVADEQLRSDGQEVILEADQAYWQVVSLVNKRKLAVSYRDMLQQLDNDVLKMVQEGVATKANELSVSVKFNEAEMTLTKVDDGLVLARMLLCQVCGLPLNSNVVLADETMDDLPVAVADEVADTTAAFANRPELRQLALATNIYDEKVKIARSAYLPSLSLMGGYLTMNPGLTNGFERRFRGTWAIGATLKVPVWNWGEGKYKIRAAKAEAKIAGLQLAEAREKIELQVTQSAFRVNEANKQYMLSQKNKDKAEENLRTARIGFREGVITTSDLLAAQTAWLQAHSDVIDSQINVKLTRATLSKALGMLAE